MDVWRIGATVLLTALHLMVDFHGLINGATAQTVAPTSEGTAGHWLL